MGVGGGGQKRTPGVFSRHISRDAPPFYLHAPSRSEGEIIDLAPRSYLRGVAHHLDLLSRLLRHLCGS